MTNDQMERRLSAALDKTAPDDVDGVLSRCTERKGTVVPMKKKNNRMKKWMQAVAACLAVLLLGGGGLLVQQAHAVTSVVSLDVNPSIELRVNSREKVVSCQALNQEAQAVLEDMDGRISGVVDGGPCERHRGQPGAVRISGHAVLRHSHFRGG